MPRRWFSIRYCPTKSLNWSRCPARQASAGGRRLSLRMHARRKDRMWLVWEWLSRKKITATDTTDFFVFGSKSFCHSSFCLHPAAIHSARLCGSFRNQKGRSRVDPAPARRVQAIITPDCGIFLEGSLTVEAKKQKKIKKQRTLMAYTSAIIPLQRNATKTKFWGTEVSSHNSRHEPPWEMNGSEVSREFFCSQWRTSREN